jgi:hypothetical protein
MPGNPRAIVAEAEREFPVRVRIGTPAHGFGTMMVPMYAWLNENCGTDGWKTAPAGTHGVLNDAVAFYFREAIHAAGFVARWCAGGATAAENGAYTVRADALRGRSELPHDGWGHDR